MSYLAHFINERNSLRKFFDQPMLDLGTSEGRNKIASLLDAAASPENLFWDGERSQQEAADEVEYLRAAADELRDLDPFVVFYEL